MGLDPVPEERRTWAAWSFAGYWFSDLFTIAGWQIASSTILNGLGTTDAILIAMVAGFCNSVPTVLNGCIGSDHHIAFPVAIRASFGYWFSYFAVVTRCVLALFWFNIQGFGGASAMAAVITSIWPSFSHLPNHLPESAGITTQTMVAYLVYNLVQFPLLLIPTDRLQWLFLAKATLVPPMVICMTVWTCLRAGGRSDIFQVRPTVHGTDRVWLWLATMTSVTGGYSTIAVNIPDFSRFSKTPTAQWCQLPLIPFFKVLTSLFGIICTGASIRIYGEYVWDPLQIVTSWGTTPGGRFAAFVASTIWLLARICCNISANSISFANDISTLFSRWFNIRRGVIFAAIVGAWGLVPWKINSAAGSLLSFMSGYAIILGQFAGIMIAGYWIIWRRSLDVVSLYDPKGTYRYNKFGTNWRAFIVVFGIVGPLVPGLARAASPSAVHIGTGLRHLYSISWLFGFFTALISYFTLMKVFPAKSTLTRRDEVLNGLNVIESDLEHQHGPDIVDMKGTSIPEAKEETSIKFLRKYLLLQSQ
ncbi:hypothetical protein MRS44_011631 [Fusarium solani]|uniref:uncharacterized protein n=1 Tax=Fusarium solani TaxID=169388 RepID=UPI0032C4323C|nr:hypothetical protein MRS44_011631 [Fusarium solani]